MSNILAESPQIERTLIALVLHKGNQARNEASSVKPDHFSDPRHAMIWKAIRAADQCSPAIVLEKIRNGNKVEAVGGESYYEELCRFAPAHSETISALSETLLGLANKRSLGRVAMELMSLSKRSDVNPSDLLSIATAKIREALPSERGRMIRTFAEALEEFADELLGFGNPDMGHPLPIKWQSLKALKGYAKAMMPRKLWLIGADSGVGKTSLVETQVDYWRMSGFSGFYWGSEWSYKEYVYRAVQRWGGASMEEIVQHKVWYAGLQKGIPVEHRPGVKLSEDVVAKCNEVYNALKSWRGNLVYLDQSANVEAICDRIAEQAARARENKNPLSFAVLDYAQLAGGSGDRFSDRMATVMSRFKQVCMEENLVGVITSQLTKDAGRAAANGEMLGQDVFQNLRTDESNLAMAIVRELDPDGKRRMAADVYVVKNSEGETGKALMLLDGKRMLWQDAQRNTIQLNEV